MNLAVLRDQIITWLQNLLATVGSWITSPSFYLELAYAAAALIIAAMLERVARNGRQSPAVDRVINSLPALGKAAAASSPLLYPLLAIITLALADGLSTGTGQQSILINLCQGLAVILLAHRFVGLFAKDHFVTVMINWIGIPIAILYVVGWLTPMIAVLDSLALEVGNVRLSVYAIARTVFFGFILFWLGRLSNTAGKRAIRSSSRMDTSTREVMVKLFEIALFTVIFLLVLQVMGINLTALAVFGGALGVGLGFGLQQIASNFVSGIIILLDRSITIGDFIELEDGRSGTIRELSMRCATVETFDGKDIMVPNERLITTSFTNWTHHDQKQRYPITFQVAYDTDLEALFEVLRETVASHPRVLSGENIPIEERPDAEIAGFGESGIEVLVEFWMEGVDDGKNRVGADLLFMIWKALKDHNVVIPYPQREVRVLDPRPVGSSTLG